MVCSAFQERPSVSHSQRQVHQLTAGQHLDLLGPGMRCGMPTGVVCRPCGYKGVQVFMSPVLALAMSAVVRGVPACQDPRVGKGCGRQGWGSRQKACRVLNPEGEVTTECPGG